ncbi:la-related protein 1B-like [Zingiber officinale]|uniref:la-related protein 1B-like n=1 Tax=Zingiber officinale TaxID=94328 RepID=UPI001C4BC1BB|nr:la-related protein 1B-like [Zingiber officinale]
MTSKIGCLKTLGKANKESERQSDGHQQRGQATAEEGAGDPLSSLFFSSLNPLALLIAIAPASAAMAAAAASSTDPSPSPSPRAGRAARQPWSHVVRGEPDGSSSSPPLMPSPDTSDRKPSPPGGVTPEAAASLGKKPAWNRPSLNGSTEPGPSVMGGSASWPALSESAKPVVKSHASASDGVPLAASPDPATSSSLPKQNLIPPGSPNYGASEHQKSIKRGGNISNGALPVGVAAVPSPPPTLAITPQANTDEKTPREQTPKISTSYEHNSRGSGSDSQVHDGGGDHRRTYSGNRRWNNGGGHGSHHGNYSNRRDQENDRSRRNAFGRDIQMQHQGVRPYLRPPPPPMPPPFPGHIPQVRPFGNPVVFPDMQSPFFYFHNQPPPGPLPFPAMYFPAMDVQRATLLKQINFYFSDENLCRDVYLRQNMDEQGWVPVSLIAGFNRVRQITNNIDFILDTLPLSPEVEVQGDRIRKRQGWMSYLLLPSSNRAANTSGQSPVALTPDNLASQLQAVDLEGTASQPRRTMILNQSAAGALNNELHAATDLSGSVDIERMGQE